jgi:GH35 family endo-1,4-beta-xylanase
MRMNTIRVALALLLSAFAARALEVPAGGQDLTVGRKARSHVESGRGAAGPLPDGGLFLDVTNAASAKGHAMQYAIGLTEGIAKKQRVLAIVRARVTDSDKGRVTAKVQMNTSPWTDIGGDTEIELFREWRDYPVLFVATENLPAGKAEFVMHVAHQRQRIEVASVRVLAYPETMDTALFPRIRRTYVGREADAPWRKEALERIERERKKDLKVALHGADGELAKNLPVKLTLKRHAFGFGSAVPVKWLLDETEDGRKYREIVDDYFSLIVFENDLKDFDWRADFSVERRAARNAKLDRAFAWLQARNIAVRGHYLMQAATPHNLYKMSNDAIRAHYLAGTRERLEFVKDRVIEWDVINHPIAWGGADMLTARPELAKIDREVFDLARSLSKLPMYVNEDQLFRPGRQSDGTFDYIKGLIEAGYMIDGIGNQAHIHESFLPTPVDVLKVTDRFAELAPRQIITEFDVVTTADEELAADYTRDLLIACFSHKAYSGFLWWGFWEGSHWKPEAASWNKDWTPRKRADVFREWVMGRWKTEITLMTDDHGVASWRGFPGWYEVRSGEQSLPMIEAK